MTSVSFNFKVGLPTDDKRIPLEPVEFRFTTKSARQLERACNGNIERVLGRGQSAEAVVLLVCYGLVWADSKMSEDKAAGMVDEFIDAGGDVVDLTVALYKALDASGVYGKRVAPQKAEGDAPLTSQPAA